MKTKTIALLGLVVALVALASMTAACTTGQLGAVPPKTRTPIPTITPALTKTPVTYAATATPARTGELTYGRVSVDSYNASPALEVNQRSTGNIVKLEDNGTAVLTLADGGNLTWAADTGTDLLNLTTGNLKVGNGTPTTTQDGEDAYVEGYFENDGGALFDGPLYAEGATHLDGAVDLDGVVTNAANLEHMLLPTIATTAFTYTAAAGGTVTLFTAGVGEVWWIHDVKLNVTTNFDAVGDDAVLVIGRDEDTDGFCTLADTELQTADTEGTGWEAGWQCQVAATRGVFLDGTGGFMLSNETIDAVISASGNDLSAGAATAYIVYTRIQ